MSGTICPVNKAISRPILIAEVEKRLVLANSLVCFTVIAATHLRAPACFLGLILFGIIHLGLMLISKHDPFFGTLVKRATRYIIHPYYPALSHPLVFARKIQTITRPW